MNLDHSTITNTRDFIRRLGSRDDRDREQAHRELPFCETTAEQFIEAFETERIRQPDLRLRAAAANWTIIGTIVALLVCLATNSRALLLLVLILAASFAAAQAMRQKRTAFERGMAVVFSHFKDVRFIGPALDIYRNEAEVETRLAPILTDLFVRANVAGGLCINARQRDVLRRECERCCMYRHFAPEMVLGGLKALVGDGDPATVPVLDKLARSAHDPDIKNYARRELPSLMDRLGLGQMKMTLLRAAQQPAVEPELLRPASNASGGDGQLLRPAAERSNDESL